MYIDTQTHMYMYLHITIILYGFEIVMPCLPAKVGDAGNSFKSNIGDSLDAVNQSLTIFTNTRESYSSRY